MDMAIRGWELSEPLNETRSSPLALARRREDTTKSGARPNEVYGALEAEIPKPLGYEDLGAEEHRRD